MPGKSEGCTVRKSLPDFQGRQQMHLHYLKSLRVSSNLTLFEKFEGKLESYRGNITRAAVELAKDWRTDKILRRLEALLLIADIEHTFIISGTGDVIEPEDGVAAIGSGGPYAQAAARALYENTSLSAGEIVEKSMKITAGICIYTNENIIIEELNG